MAYRAGYIQCIKDNVVRYIREILNLEREYDYGSSQIESCITGEKYLRN